MRKFYFAMAALLVTSTLFAGAENDVKQSLPIVMFILRESSLFSKLT